MVFPDLGLPWLPRPPAPARWAASAGAAMAYQALLSTVSLLATGRTITVRLDTGDLVVRVDRFDSPPAPPRLAAGRLDDMRLDLSEIRWQGRVFERAEVVLHKVTVGPGPLPMLMAGPIDLAVEVHGTQASDLLAAVQPGLGSRLGDDGKARLWLARRPGWDGGVPRARRFRGCGSARGSWVSNRRLRLPSWTPARGPTDRAAAGTHGQRHRVGRRHPGDSRAVGAVAHRDAAGLAGEHRRRAAGDRTAAAQPAPRRTRRLSRNCRHRRRPVGNRVIPVRITAVRRRGWSEVGMGSVSHLHTGGNRTLGTTTTDIRRLPDWRSFEGVHARLVPLRDWVRRAVPSTTRGRSHPGVRGAVCARQVLN